MLKPGQFNNLTVVKQVPFGIYLDGEDWGEILLPSKFVPKGTEISDSLTVFIYFDSEDKIIATTQRPLAFVGGFACLKVIDVNAVGAFMDWGLDKDLLVPRSEQQRPMDKDSSYIVHVKQDEKERIVASSRLDPYLNKTQPDFKAGDEVKLLVADTTPLGTKVIVNNSHWGLIHKADTFQALCYGKRIPGYIKNVREDGKLDVVLRKIGQNNIQDLTQRILDMLQNSDGFVALHDKSSAEDIQRVLGDSKKSFKSAIGQLYKRGIIDIELNGIRLRS